MVFYVLQHGKFTPIFHFNGLLKAVVVEIEMQHINDARGLWITEWNHNILKKTYDVGNIVLCCRCIVLFV